MSSTVKPAFVVEGVRADLVHAGKRDAALLAIGGPPHELHVRLGQAEEVHLGLAQPPMLQQISPLHACRCNSYEMAAMQVHVVAALCWLLLSDGHSSKVTRKACMGQAGRMFLGRHESSA